MGSEQRPSKICAVLDTETTNLKTGDGWHAFAALYQWNDVRHVPMEGYVAGGSDSISLLRHGSEVVERCRELAAWGERESVLPVVCGYNLLFDLQTVIYELRCRYPMRVCAQTDTNVYTIDLMDRAGKRPVLRLWDTYHLEMGGLAAMGRTAGLAKLDGDWDYTLVRTPETPISEEERGYAERDVQVIPAYLRYLIEANDWLDEGMLGTRVLTKTSLVRRMAENEIGPLPCGRHGQTLRTSFMAMCSQNFPRSYADYGLRKACFRGGFTFTSATNASRVTRNVASMDVTSMHHTYICGRYVPDGFEPADPATVQAAAEAVCSTSLESVLSRYHKPFFTCFHARIRFRNIRLRPHTCFDRWRIALIPRGKFQASPDSFWGSEAQLSVEEEARRQGWVDRARNARFAFSKLYSSEECVLHLTEVELWCVSRVYEWDSMEVELGEVTTHQVRPPDYVTLQSNVLFERKQAMKTICNGYTEGEPYAPEVPGSVPDGIAAAVRDGSASAAFLSSYYNSTVKGAFNSVYGTMAQDEMRADYMVDEAADISVDRDTAPTPENFAARRPKRPKVLYTYGMRIVGGSRMHMVIALELLDRALGPLVEVCGGDTDSMKVACDPGVSDGDLTAAMEPLEDACDRAVSLCMGRVRKAYPDLASPLTGLGHFEVERCGPARRYPVHMELWNKARISVDAAGRAHVTMAGLSRPAGTYHIERWLEDMAAERGWEWVLTECVGYGSTVCPDVSHALVRTYPGTRDRVALEVTDHTGAPCAGDAYEAVARDPAARRLGDPAMPSNRENIGYLRGVVGTPVRSDERWVDMRGGRPWLREI